MLIGASDLLAQRLASSAPANWRRTLCMALYGALWVGPSGHYWQQLLERFFPDKQDPLRRCVCVGAWFGKGDMMLAAAIPDSTPVPLPPLPPA